MSANRSCGGHGSPRARCHRVRAARGRAPGGVHMFRGLCGLCEFSRRTGARTRAGRMPARVARRRAACVAAARTRATGSRSAGRAPFGAIRASAIAAAPPGAAGLLARGRVAEKTSAAGRAGESRACRPNSA
ncbi:conserved hypothetical protein [Burkholderia pseudomallei MSHR346]|nr:conserved hypothetical protein [Burkholderia pseudomallei MSHR346]